MKTQSGYTIMELVMVLWGIVALCILGGLLYAVGHFIQKFW